VPTVMSTVRTGRAAATATYWISAASVPATPGTPGT
jgi:hypothetical protein